MLVKKKGLLELPAGARIGGGRLYRIFFLSGFACMPRFSVAVLSVFEFGIHPIAKKQIYQCNFHC